MVRDWLFLVLRFAITREAADRIAALTLAAELDALGTGQFWVPRFFLRTSAEVCAAITERRNPVRRSVLMTHAGRIDDVRLRRAFLDAVELGQQCPMPATQTRTKMAQRANV
jgi:hypothetical protein